MTTVGISGTSWTLPSGRWDGAAPFEGLEGGSQFIALNNVAVKVLKCLRSVQPTNLQAEKAILHMTQWAEGVVKLREDFITRAIYDIIPGAEFLLTNYGVWEVYRRNYGALAAAGVSCPGIPTPYSVEPTASEAIKERARDTVDAFSGPELAPLIKALKEALAPVRTLATVAIVAVGLGLFFKIAGPAVGEGVATYQNKRRSLKGF